MLLREVSAETKSCGYSGVPMLRIKPVSIATDAAMRWTLPAQEPGHQPVTARGACTLHERLVVANLLVQIPGHLQMLFEVGDVLRGERLDVGILGIPGRFLEHL